MTKTGEETSRRTIPMEKRKISTTTKSHMRLLVGSIFVIILLINLVQIDRSVEAKKVKKEKILKSLLKGLLLKNLSVKKNFLPLPVPIPVRIELSEPPIYLKGQPKYVSVYKPTEKPKKVYQPIPMYLQSDDYMINPYDNLYGSMMIPNKLNDYVNTDYKPSNEVISTKTTSTSHGPNIKQVGDTISGGSTASKTTSQTNQMTNKSQGSSSREKGGSKDSSAESVVRGKLTIKFTDFDDDSGGYYLAQMPAQSSSNRLAKYIMLQRADLGNTELEQVPSLQRTDDDEAVDEDSKPRGRRVKRQVSYTSDYDRPCYGFPLEINVKSRIKMDNVFPIFGKSQVRKCVDLTKPIIPPPAEYDRYP